MRFICKNLLLLFLPLNIYAHVSDTPFLIHELTDDEISLIDMSDQSVDEWRELFGEPTITAKDLTIRTDVGDGAPYNPDDLDYQIWLAWNRTANRIYVAMERFDNVYLAYAGDDFRDQLWQYDAFQFMVDGDHSGGDFSSFVCEDVFICGKDPNLENNRHAQHYMATAAAPDGRHIWYLGWGNNWVTLPPYADAKGGDNGKSIVTELYITPFDDLLYTDQKNSVKSSLYEGKIVGFEFIVADFDASPGEFRSYHVLSAEKHTWRFAERLVDGILVGASQETNVAPINWARIKASFQER